MNSPKPFFLPSGSGQRFCLYHPAVNAQGVAPRGHVVYVHPFGEEMNKSRRMATLQARALAQAGFSVLQVDLLGCGDSSGDFGDAVWHSWVADVVLGCHWLRSHAAPAADSGTAPPLWLWGLRAGCLVAVAAARQLGLPCNFLFWQAPSAGKLLLQQFLRLKVAGDMLGGQAKGVMEAMRQQLANGASVEIAGYTLSAGLAAGLEQALLTPLSDVEAHAPAALPTLVTREGPLPRRLEWLEVSTREDAALSPVATKTITEWQQAGIVVRSRIVPGPSFWQTTEIEDAPALICATTAALLP
jgi:exosortase A-associated hydrolase 2